MNVMSRHSALRRGVLFLLLPLLATTARAVQLPGPLVETGWLADNLEWVVVLDVRKDGKSYAGQSLPKEKGLDLTKLTGHIPGAVTVPWKDIVAKGREGQTMLKGMLPPADRFARLMRESGVDDDSAVIVAGRGAGAKDQTFATRLYFTLKYFGHDNIALLNGGTAQWAREGRPLSHELVAPQPGTFSVRGRREQMLATTADVEQAIEGDGVQLLDCRPEDFFYGLTYKRKFVAPSHKGHIPGAKNLPHVMLADNFGPALLFPAEEIHKVMALKGVDPLAPTIAYCNTGVVASLSWFVLHELYENPQVRLYDGSMHAWSTVDSSHPVRSLAAVIEEKPVAGAETQVTADSEPQLTLAEPQPLHLLPVSLERRRDQLRRDRGHYIDAVTGRYLFQPPWVRAREEMMEAYRDGRREFQRQRRDAVRSYRDDRRRFYNPRTQLARDRAEERRTILRTAQLQRQELSYRDPFGDSW